MLRMILPQTFGLEALLWNNSASCHVETPRLEGLGISSDAKTLMGIHPQWSNFKIAPPYNE